MHSVARQPRAQARALGDSNPIRRPSGSRRLSKVFFGPGGCPVETCFAPLRPPSPPVLFFASPAPRRLSSPRLSTFFPVSTTFTEVAP
ncbi:hypothetical protein [Desulfonatronum thiodismutans]|uniref:hypothetical protein n=1 Tax=Desulfonatronum thiodismutans TaxID=159290 RepID=UPI001267A2C2|nr:hypothetical protein [Desulfonatronum thiodismutans]